MSGDDLPSSGDPGVAPPAAGSLPRPAMWPEQAREAPFDGLAADTATPPTPGRRKVAYGGAALMVVAAVLVGLSVVATSWVLLAVGLVLGVTGAVVAFKAGIMEDVSVSDSAHG